MGRREPERKHLVRADLKVRELTRAGSSLNLNIYSRHQKIGELAIGRGSLYWWGGKRHRRKRVGWSRFATIMNELAYGRRSRRAGD